MGDGGTETSESRTLKGPSRYCSGRQAVWIHALQTSGTVYYNYNYDYGAGEANYKSIYSAFAALKSFPFKTILFQFWRPVSDGGRLILASFPKLCAASSFIRGLRDKYRPCSLKYQYSTDVEGDHNQPAWIIRGGPVSTAFLNRFPEVVMDLRAHHGSPLVDLALECGLTSSVMLPVFYGLSSECVGVIECSLKHPSLLLPISNEMKRELERVGLSIYYVQGSWPYKTISGDLQPAKIEIEKALAIACESHDLSLGQVWISYEIENDRMFLVKLSRYCVVSVDDSDPLSSVKDFYNRHDVIPLKTGEGLVGKTLQTHQMYLCKNIYKLSDNKGILAILSANASIKCASFVVCLRSSHTGELDYAFEFFWPCSRDHLIMLETLLSTLNKYLPSFKFASGEQLGDEVFVVDIENSCSGSGSRLVKILHSDDDGDGDGDGNDDDVAILATYRNETLLFDLPCSSTFENVMVKLKKEFEMDHAWTYKVEYEVLPDQWLTVVSLKSCRRKEDMGLIKLRVRDEGRVVGWRWRTN